MICYEPQTVERGPEDENENREDDNKENEIRENVIPTIDEKEEIIVRSEVLKCSKCTFLACESCILQWYKQIRSCPHCKQKNTFNTRYKLIKYLLDLCGIEHSHNNVVINGYNYDINTYPELIQCHCENLLKINHKLTRYNDFIYDYKTERWVDIYSHRGQKLLEQYEQAKCK